MEEEAPSRCSVAELAGRFKCSNATPHDAAGNEKQERPVRRRPPRSLQIPIKLTDDKEPPGAISPLPAKAKRNSALIEKLQANLALSPTALLPSPKSPGFRLFPPTFTLPSPGSAPPVPMGTSPSTLTPSSPPIVSPLTEEEGPISFEAPPTIAEGSILSNINKGRPRLSLRRRPPSRRHRKSSSGDEVNNEGGDPADISPIESTDKISGGDGGGGGGGHEEDGEIFNKEAETKEEKTDDSEANISSKDPSELSVEPREEEEEAKEAKAVERGEEKDGSQGKEEVEVEKAKPVERGQENDGSQGKDKEEVEKNTDCEMDDSADGGKTTDSKDFESTDL